MKREFVKIAGKEYPRVHDTVLIGDWQELSSVNAKTIRPELPEETLDGLLIKGYEMKWGETNENGERYEQTAFDKFIQEYFVKKGFNMVTDINHEGYMNWHAQCGRVLYIERNSVGFYFAVYVPREFEDYEALKWRLQKGIIQGFSKEGYAAKWEPRYKEDRSFDYMLIKEMNILSVSLVSAPANGLRFEKMQETIKDGLQYFVKEVEDNTERGKGKSLSELFNKINK